MSFCGGGFEADLVPHFYQGLCFAGEQAGHSFDMRPNQLSVGNNQAQLVSLDYFQNQNFNTVRNQDQVVQ